ncbi:MAG: hypothetical protein FJY07_07130 [Bacteroidetes bacterium]|nr:hypothetical protein [Bacteroidota bacterium]
MQFLTNSIDNNLVVSLVSSMILFMAPSVLLGMVSPFAVRIKLKSVTHSGSTVGKLYALSTAGSIAGVFLAGFYLVPSFRITDILLLLSIVLIAVSLFLNGVYQLINFRTKHKS